MLFMTALLFSATLLTGCPVNMVTATDETMASAAAEFGDTIEVRNRSGSIDIRGWEKSEVEVIATRRIDLFYGQFVTPDDPRDFLDDILIEVTETEEGIRIETDIPVEWQGSQLVATVHYEIMVPEEAILDIDQDNGSVEVTGILGAVEVDLANGPVECEHSAGDFNINVNNGSVEITHPALPAVDAEIDCTVDNGSIALWLPAESAFDLDADVELGEITVDTFPLTVEVEGPSASASGTINGGGADVELLLDLGEIEIGAI
jgi:hypothetical protein